MHVTFLADLHILSANKIQNYVTTNTINDERFVIKLQDVTAREPMTLINFINTKLANLNVFLLYRYSLVFFDKQVWKKEVFREIAVGENIELSMDDLQLLKRYTNITLHSRLILHDVLVDALPDVNTPPPETNLTNVRPPLSSAIEKDVLSRSKALLDLSKRQAEEKKHPSPSVDYTDFYGIEFAKKQTNPKTSKSAEQLKLLLRKKHIRHLQQLQLPVSGDVSETDHAALVRLLQDNMKMISIGKKISHILTLETTKLAPDFASELFTTQLVHLSLCPFSNKPIFNLECEQFFSKSDTSNLTVYFPPRLSYSLGQTKEESVIGPLCGNPGYVVRRQTEHSITKSGISLGNALRHCPKVVRIASNILSSSELFDGWLDGTDSQDLNLVHSQLLDSAMLDARYITKLDENRLYYRMLRSSDVLNSIRIKLLDENCQSLMFPKNTVTNVGLCVTPYKAEDTF